MGRDINLDGTEISIIKALGIGTPAVDGATLRERCADLDLHELMDTVKGLMSVGYVEADDQTFYDQEVFDRNTFHVNSGYAKGLKEAIDPQDEPRQSKRVRRE